jgi:DNA polymerase-1
MSSLLPGWENVSMAPLPEPTAPTPIVVPVDLDVAVAKTRLICSAAEGAELLHTLQSLPVSAVALDSEYQFGRPPVTLRNGKEWSDVRSQTPICFSLAALVTQDGSQSILRAVLDVRSPGVAEALGAILRLRVPTVMHYSKAELFSLWSLGLDPDFPQLFDTHLAAACLQLGAHHRRSSVGTEDAEALGAAAEQARAKLHLLSLAGQCAHYDLPFPFTGSKDELRMRFLELGDEPLDQRMVEYAAADAEWTLRLYCAQQKDILVAGLHDHLHQVEFPFAVANARIEWNGVFVSRARLEKLRTAAQQAADHHAAVLGRHGVESPGSRKQFLALMESLGLRQHCRRSGKDCVAEEVLEPIEHLHEAIRAFRLHGRYRRLAGEEWLTGCLIGSDGRLHPRHEQLGAATGRNSCRQPNLAGIGRVHRPVVVAPPGRALIELDYSQVEVGVAAAEHQDPHLIEAFNSGDVYAAMAQRFYEAELPEGARGLSVGEFKTRHPELRARMKTFVLAVLYNIQARGIALRFNISERRAAEERERFLDLFPVLKRRLQESADYGAVRGYASIVSGLRRQRPSKGRADGHTRNFLRNTPIQGSAAVVFKHAIVLLDREFRGGTVQLVLPVHDSILIECDLTEVADVTERAQFLMRHAIRSFYPQLQPRIDVNDADMSCWNKDGCGDSLDRFLQEPGILTEDCLRPEPQSGTGEVSAIMQTHRLWMLPRAEPCQLELAEVAP